MMFLALPGLPDAAETNVRRPAGTKRGELISPQMSAGTGQLTSYEEAPVTHHWEQLSIPPTAPPSTTNSWPTSGYHSKGSRRTGLEVTCDDPHSHRVPAPL